MPFIAIALLIAAAIGGGTSVAAQNALPGDALWGFKVGVNENIQAALAAEGKAQADFDIAAIKSRLKEAGELSANAKLDAGAQADIEANFESHAKSVMKQIEKLQAKGDYSEAADVAVRLQAAIASQASGLSNATAQVEARGSAQAQSVLNSLLVKVRGTLETASTVSADASAKAAANAEADSSTSGSGSVETDTSVKVDTKTGVEVEI